MGDPHLKWVDSGLQREYHGESLHSPCSKIKFPFIAVCVLIRAKSISTCQFDEKGAVNVRAEILEREFNWGPTAGLENSVEADSSVNPWDRLW